MQFNILMSGTASDVLGMDSDTVFKNTVRDSNTVTSETQNTREPSVFRYVRHLKLYV